MIATYTVWDKVSVAIWLIPPLLYDWGANAFRVCVLLRKAKTRAEELDADFVGFEIGDEFVIGYGLDYAEQYRNLPFVGVLRREVFENPSPA